MMFKELVRTLINAEMQDISLYTAEAKAFGGHPTHGARIAELFTGFAEQELRHLKALGEVVNENTGFRYRNTEVPRSIEAALRTHVNRENDSIVMYRDLLKHLLKKPEGTAVIKGIILSQRAHLAAIRDLQEQLKKK